MRQFGWSMGCTRRKAANIDWKASMASTYARRVVQSFYSKLRLLLRPGSLYPVTPTHHSRQAPPPLWGAAKLAGESSVFLSSWQLTWRKAHELGQQSAPKVTQPADAASLSCSSRQQRASGVLQQAHTSPQAHFRCGLQVSGLWVGYSPVSVSSSAIAFRICSPTVAGSRGFGRSGCRQALAIIRNPVLPKP